MKQRIRTIAIAMIITGVAVLALTALDVYGRVTGKIVVENPGWNPHEVMASP